MLIPRLQPRTSSAPPWFPPSASLVDGEPAEITEARRWIQERTAAHGYRVEQIPFASLDGWAFDPATGNLGHRSGRFFTVEGLRVQTENTVGGAEPRRWSQPVLNQPEVGILGLLVKDFGGVPHILMQAKMEPGNRTLVELSPTVQATRSNYTRVHGGAATRYLEYFTDRGRPGTLADVLQSEQGTWFYRKVNRNMIVKVTEDVEPHEDYRWLSLAELAGLLRLDNVVSMDARSTLSCLPVPCTESGALHTDAELLYWFTEMRARHSVVADRIPLADVPGWRRTESAIEHDEGRYFRIVATSVWATSREVTGWSQPLLEPCGTGVVCFLACQIDGVWHVLAQARAEPGFAYSVELAPTVQCNPANHAHLPPDQQPRFLADVLAADPSRIRYQAVHSEEGGRFRHAETRYMVVEVDEPFQAPPEFQWVTRGQLATLVQHGHYLNVEARTLLAVLNVSEAAYATPVNHS
jgi:oxidase EvaA